MSSIRLPISGLHTQGGGVDLSCSGIYNRNLDTEENWFVDFVHLIPISKPIRRESGVINWRLQAASSSLNTQV